ncbi:hypothetical protein JCM8547_006158 [Rhodosporidiobolus lusitaniae]
MAALVQSGEWKQALELATTSAGHSLAVPPEYTAYLAQERLLAFTSPSTSSSSASLPTPDDLDRLYPLVAPFHPQWLAAFFLSFLSHPFLSLDLARKAVDLGLKATDRWIATLTELSDAVGEKDWGRVDELCAREDGEEREVVQARRAFFEAQDRATTWEAIWADGGKGGSVAGDEEEGKKGDNEEEEKEDGWGDDLDLDLPGADASPSSSRPFSPPPRAPTAPPAVPPTSTPSRPTLPSFLTLPLLTSTLSLSASSSLPELLLLCSLHSHSLYPHRREIVEAIPEWVDPTEYSGLLPAVDFEKGVEKGWEDEQPWRSEGEKDWSESPSLTSLFLSSGEGEGGEAPRTPKQLEEWYLSRITRLSSLGTISPALLLVQHAASKGVMGLDLVGEELHLLSKLVYERPSPPPGQEGDEQEREGWTLERFRSMEPKEVLRAYVRFCDASNLPTTIRRLVLPYLSVLESRLERSSSSSFFSPAETPLSLLYDYILSLPSSTSQPGGLALLLSLFQSSKPTLPSGARIIKSDTDLARLALACLYGAHAPAASSPGGALRTPTEEDVLTMGQIFECLPAFPPSSPSSSSSLPPPLALSPTLPSPLTPSTLFPLLTPYTPAALTSALDLLDLHLSQLESFLRFSCAPPGGLGWFLKSYGEVKDQRGWATRLARTAAQGGVGQGRAGGGEGRGGGGEFEGEDEWTALREFMAQCTEVVGASEEGEEGKEGEEERAREKGMGRAFWKLGAEEVVRIFFGGLLGAGRFSLARALFQPSSGSAPPSLEPHVVEELVISASREFYDNAEEGSLHRGEMKLAFECLSAAPTQTPLIRSERAFIEATSRLLSFRLPSPSSSNLTLTPIEVRHAPDRLAFISQLLSTPGLDAHKHPEMVLELTRKLGYPSGGKAEVRVLGMVSEAATQAGEWEVAAEMCERAQGVVESLRKRRSRRAQSTSTAAGAGAVAGEDDQDPDAAADHAWRACFFLGKQTAWPDLEKRKNAVGQALVLCPPERIADILPLWTELEREVAREQARRAREEQEGGARKGAEFGLREAEEVVSAGAAKVANFLSTAVAGAAASAAGTPRSSTTPVPPSPSSSSSHPTPAPTSPTKRERAAEAAAHGRDLASEAAEAASRAVSRAAAYLPGAFAGAVATGGRASRMASASPSRSAAPSSPVRANSTTPSTAPVRRTGRTKLGAKPISAAPSPYPAASPAPPSPLRPSARPSSPPPHLSSSSSFNLNRPSSPSSPPSRFAAAFDSLPPSSSQPTPFSSGFGIRAGLSSKLTAGVGWLIGADEMREEEERERERVRMRETEERRKREEQEREVEQRREEKVEEEKKGGGEEEVDEEGWGW